jgi:hypothetical protein
MMQTEESVFELAEQAAVVVHPGDVVVLRPERPLSQVAMDGLQNYAGLLQE